MSEPERWLPGDVVLAAEGEIWKRTDQAVFPWLVFGSCCEIFSENEEVPVRPLTLLIRNGHPVGTTRNQLVSWSARILHLAYLIEDEAGHDSAVRLAGEIREAADLLGTPLPGTPEDERVMMRQIRERDDAIE